MACIIPIALSSTRWRTTQLSWAVALAERAAAMRAKVECSASRVLGSPPVNV
jgi:hypothetical protein